MKVDDFLKNQIKNISPETLLARGVLQLANDKKTYICPFCGNGTGKSGDGLAVKQYSWGYNFRCFGGGCGGANYDNIALLANYYGLNPRADFIEVCKHAAADFLGIFDTDNNSDFSACHNLTPLKTPPEKTIVQNETDIELKKLTQKYIDAVLQLADNLENVSEENLRGLSVETLRYFHCVYVERWIHPKTFAEYKLGLRDTLPLRSRRILIPSYDKKHYVAVLVQSDRTPENKKYWKMHTSEKSPFGLQTLCEYTECIWIYEGEFNCLTAFQSWNVERNFLKKTMLIFRADSTQCLETGEVIKAGSIPYSAFIATGGAAESNWIESLDAKCKELGISPRIVINFDKDKAGEGGAEKIQKELRARGYIVTVNFVKGDDE